MKARLSDRWRQLALRERQLCGALVFFLLIVFGFYGLWQPAQQRLQTAQTLYLKRLAEAGELQRAEPVQALKTFKQPLTTRLSEGAASAGLDVQQFEVQAEVIRLTLSGEAGALLTWLDGVEQDGASFQSLALEKREQHLEARLVINSPARL